MRASVLPDFLVWSSFQLHFQVFVFVDQIWGMWIKHALRPFLFHDTLSILVGPHICTCISIVRKIRVQWVSVSGGSWDLHVGGWPIQLCVVWADEFTCLIGVCLIKSEFEDCFSKEANVWTYDYSFQRSLSALKNEPPHDKFHEYYSKLSGPFLTTYSAVTFGWEIFIGRRATRFKDLLSPFKTSPQKINLTISGLTYLIWMWMYSIYQVHGIRMLRMQLGLSSHYLTKRIRVNRNVPCFHIDWLNIIELRII